MARLFIPLLVVVLAIPAAAGSQDSPARGTGLTIDFVATDRNGAPADLTADQVEIWIGHFQVPIERLARVAPNRDNAPGRLTVLLLDDMTLANSFIPRVKQIAQEFVSRLRPGDQMSIVTLSGTEMTSTDDPARLKAAIDRYSPRANVTARPDILNEDVLKNVAALSQQAREVSAGRKTIVAIGSSALLDRPLPPPTGGRDFAPEWIAAMRALALAHVSFYVIDPMGVGAGRAYTGQDGFARATGGRAFIGTNDFNGAVDRILRDTADFYVAAVPNPPNGSRTSLRELEIKVRRPGVTVLARRAIP